MKKILYFLPLLFLAHTAGAFSTTLSVSVSPNEIGNNLSQFATTSVSGTTGYQKGCVNIYNTDTDALVSDTRYLDWAHGAYPLTTSTEIFENAFGTSSLPAGNYTWLYWETNAGSCPAGNVSLASAITNYGVGGTDTFTIYGWGGNLLPMTLLYPQDRTDIFIHDFTHFTYVATNTDSVAHNYNFRVVYDTTSTLDYAPVIVSRNIQYGFAPGATHFLNIPKPQTLASSTTYWAKLCASVDSGDFSCLAPISFKTGAVGGGYQVRTETAGWFNSTTTESGIMYPTSTTDINSATGLICGTEFYNPANWACWSGQRIILLWNELKDFAVGTFEMGFDFFRQTFPINILSQLSDDLNSVQYSTSTISSISFTGQGTAYKKASGGYYTFTFLTSSTLQESETAVGWNWETIVIYLLWALTGIVIVGSAFALIKHAGHNSNPHA